MKILFISSHREKEIISEVEGILKMIPTDTVYGLICDGLNNRAKERTVIKINYLLALLIQ